MEYQVVYTAVYYVNARDEEHALELGAEKHAEFPDGEFSAVPDPYVSPLSSLQDGTYAITEAHSVAVRVYKLEGYWVAVEAVEALPDAGQYLGVWTDSAGQRFYDLTRHIESLDEALAVASYYGQREIWDCQANKAIPVI
jgi:hypothetical protein